MTNEPPPLDALLSAILYLITRQATNPQEHLPAAITIHLDWLATHPEANRYPVLLKTANNLAKNWSSGLSEEEQRLLGTRHQGGSALH